MRPLSEYLRLMWKGIHYMSLMDEWNPMWSACHCEHKVDNVRQSSYRILENDDQLYAFRDIVGRFTEHARVEWASKIESERVTGVISNETEYHRLKARTFGFVKRGAVKIVSYVVWSTVLVEREQLASTLRIWITECIPEYKFLDFEKEP